MSTISSQINLTQNILHQSIASHSQKNISKQEPIEVNAYSQCQSDGQNSSYSTILGKRHRKQDQEKQQIESDDEEKGSQFMEEDDGIETHEKREKRLLQNRKSAKKCRSKKKAQFNCLKNDVIKISDENKMYKDKISEMSMMLFTKIEENTQLQKKLEQAQLQLNHFVNNLVVNSGNSSQQFQNQHNILNSANQQLQFMNQSNVNYNSHNLSPISSNQGLLQQLLSGSQSQQQSLLATTASPNTLKSQAILSEKAHLIMTLLQTLTDQSEIEKIQQALHSEQIQNQSNNSNLLNNQALNSLLHHHSSEKANTFQANPSLINHSGFKKVIPQQIGNKQLSPKIISQIIDKQSPFINQYDKCNNNIEDVKNNRNYKTELEALLKQVNPMRKVSDDYVSCNSQSGIPQIVATFQKIARNNSTRKSSNSTSSIQ